MAGELILAVDDNADALYALKRILEHEGFQVITASHGREALMQARSGKPELILLDVVMPEADGITVTRELKSDPLLRYLPIVLLTAKDGLADIVKGLDAGADGYITKPYQPEELIARVRAALRTRALYEQLQHSENENARLSSELSQINGSCSFEGIVGDSLPIREVLTLAGRFAASDAPVLIMGPTGVGKELLARALHFNSKRRAKRFLAVNCASLSESLAESELFGHVRGAFTGALRDKVGLFEAASGGTLFLDEVGELTLPIQAKLLRAIQEGVVMPVGATAERKVDVRLVTATNRDLEQMSREGKFREDLFFRLNVLTLHLPPLRERASDIPALIETFLRRFSARDGLRNKKLEPRLLDCLTRYSWPGNIRELENEVERLLILGRDSEQLTTEHLSLRILNETLVFPSSADGAQDLVQAPLDLKAAISKLERQLIGTALKQCGGNKSNASKILGISRSNLIAKVKEYQLEDSENQ